MRSQLDRAALDSDLTYADFRTGLTFADVYQLIYTRRWKRRRGVLGAWRALKLEMWDEYQRRVSAAMSPPLCVVNGRPERGDRWL